MASGEIEAVKSAGDPTKKAPAFAPGQQFPAGRKSL